MSVGPLNSLGSYAGAPLAQTKGSEVDRARQDAVKHEFRLREQLSADDAAGISEADGEDKRAEDRDADGRRLWEFSEPRAAGEESETEPQKQSIDPDGNCGRQLDLSG